MTGKELKYQLFESIRRYMAWSGNFMSCSALVQYDRTAADRLGKYRQEMHEAGKVVSNIVAMIPDGEFTPADHRPSTSTDEQCGKNFHAVSHENRIAELEEWARKINSQAVDNWRTAVEDRIFRLENADAQKNPVKKPNICGYRMGSMEHPLVANDTTIAVTILRCGLEPGHKTAHWCNSAEYQPLSAELGKKIADCNMKSVTDYNGVKHDS